MKKKNQMIAALLVALTLCLSFMAGCTPAPAETGQPPVSPSASVLPGASVPPSDAAQQKVVLVISFGTSYNETREVTIEAVEAAIGKAFPDYELRRAFTSQIIIDKLAERDGLVIDNVTQAMDRLVADGVKEVVIQPTHVMDGYEYSDIVTEVSPYAEQFDSIKFGRQLLDSDADYEAVAAAITDGTKEYEADGTAILFMGHGTEHEAGIAYTRLQERLTAAGKTNYYIATVEGEPKFEEVRAQLAADGVTRIVLVPLMIVAGDHASNDMAGSEADSWQSILTAEGYEVESLLMGLGEYPGVQELFVRHALEAPDFQPVTPEAPAPGSGVAGDGVYSITVTSSSSMFKIVDAKLTVAGDEMSAVLTLSGTGYEKLYMGTGEEALAASDGEYAYFAEDAQGAYTYEVPVAALDTELDVAAWSIKNEQWYDRVIVFESVTAVPAGELIDDMPPPDTHETQDGQYTIAAALTGGSGKASVISPARITFTDGAATAIVEWSSPNYEFMIVGEVTYYPVNTEGNSTFEIPVTLDEDMAVSAQTIAMSEPHLVDYTLRFDSSTLTPAG